MAEKKYKNPYQEYTDKTDVGADGLLLSSEQQAGVNQAKVDWQKAHDTGDQAGMDAAHKRAEAIRDQAGYSGGANGGAYNPFDGGGDSGVHMSTTHTTSPQWTSRYDQQRADTVAQIQSRKPFSYDPEKDPTYQQYKKQYERGAAKSMQDTMGQVMARTGGLASSFSQVAGQQNYNAYMAGLADKVPELRQLAYQMYMDEGDRLRSDLQMYDSLDSTDASRWATTVLNPYQTDRAFAFQQEQAARDAAQQALENQRWQTQYDDSRGDVAYNRAYQERMDQEEKAAALAELLATGGDYSGYGNLYGMTPEQQQMLQELARENLDYDRKSRDLNLQGQELDLELARKQIANYGRSSGGGYRGSGKGDDETTGDPLDVIMNMSESDARRTLLSMGLPQWQVNEYMALYQQGLVPENSEVYAAYQDLERKLMEIEDKWGGRGASFNDKILDEVGKAQGLGLNNEQANRILARYGIRR